MQTGGAGFHQRHRSPLGLYQKHIPRQQHLPVSIALVARAVVSQRVKPGMCLMYHAQEKIVNVPGSEITHQRGGIHNSVTRTVLKPTHMIGGYAQQSYGFNYYGTVGCNRDEFIIIRRMVTVDWLDGTASTTQAPVEKEMVP